MKETKKRDISRVEKICISISIFLVMGIFLGFVVGSLYNKKSAEKNSLEENAKLMSKLEKVKKYFPSVSEMKSVYGTVKDINGNVSKIETGESSNPFEELPTIREVTVTHSTKIVKQEQKSPAEFQKEMEAFQKKMQQNLNGTISDAVPPATFTEKEIKASDIKVNDMITVESSTNIKTSAEIEAAKIIVSSNNLPPSSNILPAAPAQPSALSAPAINRNQQTINVPTPPAGQAAQLTSPSPVAALLPAAQSNTPLAAPPATIAAAPAPPAASVTQPPATSSGGIPVQSTVPLPTQVAPPVQLIPTMPTNNATPPVTLTPTPAGPPAGSNTQAPSLTEVPLLPNTQGTAVAGPPNVV